MKNIIIGTAGHIDHGKTTLIKSLTGFDTDRLKEEKERGITIDLGFSYFSLPDGQKVGIIDVPGHENYLNNMLSGIVGMDLILFVVAGDEGVMPQTIEHLNILNLIGIEKGIVVITKKDLIDDEMIELVIEDIKDHFGNTFLENAPVVMISSKTGEGIDELKDIIIDLSSQIKPRDEKKPARMPIDRIFTLKGIGTVITGTLIEGLIEINDELFIYPQKNSARVRNIQVHGENVDVVYAGQRAAINIVISSKVKISRGDLIAEKESMHISNLLDVELINLKDSGRIIKNSSRIHFFIGTKETIGTVVLFGRKELIAGEKCFAQIRFTEELSVKYGDKFIIRFYSPLETIGGGVIIDPRPSVKKTSKYHNNDLCEVKMNSNISEVILQFIKEKPVYIDKSDLHKSFAFESIKIDKTIEALEKNNKIINFNDGEKILLIEFEKFNEIKDSIISILSSFHKINNLKPGINKETLFNNISLNISSNLFNKILKKIEQENLIIINNEFVSLINFEMKLNENQTTIYSKIKLLLDEDDKILKKEDLIELDKKNIILDFMNYNKEIVIINDEYLINTLQFENIKKLLREQIEVQGYITVAEARNIINTSRKKILVILEYLDNLKFTKRVDDKRVLC